MSKSYWREKLLLSVEEILLSRIWNYWAISGGQQSKLDPQVSLPLYVLLTSFPGLPWLSKALNCPLCL